MTTQRISHPRDRVILTVAAVALAAPLFAQTPPRPAVRVVEIPQFDWGTWPADLNGDGRTDLVGSRPIGTFPVTMNLIVALGRGDGSFTPPTSLNLNAAPLGVGDFNGDGRIDVVIADPSGIAILPGNGNATFGAVRRVTGPFPSPNDGMMSDNALVGDLNGDGRRDLVLVTQSSIDIYPGNGDFTFAPAVRLPSGSADGGPRQAIAADFNGDGARDIAAVLTSGGIDIFMNRGAFLFDVATVTTPVVDFRDITAGDLNGDGRADLVVVASVQTTADWWDGLLYTLLGNGDGTFQPAVFHDTQAAGTVAVVVGDFNADARLDIAAGTRSWRYAEVGIDYHYWDTVTILAGNGNGTFTAPASFSLSYVDYEADPFPRFRDTLNNLQTSDVNGDRRTDLITSPGTIVLNVAPVANRPPTVFAGPDRALSSSGDHTVCLNAVVGDPDFDRTSVMWHVPDGNYPVPEFCTSIAETTTLTVEISDGRGGTARDDMVFFVPEPINEDGELPGIGFEEPDSGDTVSVLSPSTIRWSASENAGFARFRLLASGDDGRTFTAIAGCQNVVSGGGRALCTWESPRPVSTRARLRVEGYNSAGTLLTFAVSDRFLIVGGPPTDLPDGWFQNDVGAVSADGSATFTNGTFTVRGAGADIWGTADEFHYAYTSRSGDFDIVARVAGVQNVSQWTKAGLMVRNDLRAGAAHASIFATPSTVKGVSAQARSQTDGISREASRRALAPPLWLKLMRRGTVVHFAYRQHITDPWMLHSTVSIGLNASVLVGLAVSSHADGTVATATFDNVSIVDAPAWQNQDIGAIGVAGREVPSSDISRTTLDGSGTDIWGAADAFHYRYTPWSGDGTITVRVLGVEHTHAWAKAGVMFRESAAAGSKQVMAIVSAGKGVAMQYRGATEGASANSALAAGTAPRWLRLTRAGNTFTGAASVDGVTWSALGSTTIAMGDSVLVGLAVTSHNNSTLATAVFDDIALAQ